MDFKNFDFSLFKKQLDTHHKKIVKAVYKKHANTLALAKVNALSIIGGALLTGSVATTNLDPTHKHKVKALMLQNTLTDASKNALDYSKLVAYNNILLNNPDNLTLEQEQLAEQLISSYFGVDTKVMLDNNRMLRVWGYFGQEQHLYRWKGDSLANHGEYLQHGIAPATGAFGYFDNEIQEKWYIAAPIHMLPNWNSNWPTLKPWYRFRKVLVYNPKTQKAAIAVVGDAGPASWTGKHFGGSPELMHYLDMKDGRAKSKAIVLFVDESKNKYDLGPVEIKDIINKDQVASLN